MRFRGKVGDGKKYDSQTRVWEEELVNVFGYKPFQGTLNIYVRPNLNEEELLKNYDVINPFPDFVCVEGSIKDTQAHFCYSKKRKHQVISTFYVISEFKLRDKLSVKNGNWVEFTLKKKKDEAV
jgi:CTP-dependent riboflavin kinase